MVKTLLKERDLSVERMTMWLTKWIIINLAILTVSSESPIQEAQLPDEIDASVETSQDPLE